MDLPIRSLLVEALTVPKPVPQAQATLWTGVVSATTPSIRVDVTTGGASVSYKAEKLTTYTAVVADPVLVAIIGARVIIIGKIG